jgi:hypothetical protein
MASLPYAARLSRPDPDVAAPVTFARPSARIGVTVSWLLSFLI